MRLVKLYLIQNLLKQYQPIVILPIMVVKMINESCIQLLEINYLVSYQILHLKLGFKRSFNWTKNQLKVSVEAQSSSLDYLVAPSFQGVNKSFGLLFENIEDRTKHSGYFLPKRSKSLHFYDRWTAHFLSTTEKLSKII